MWSQAAAAVAVIIPSRSISDRLAACLDALAAQTLAPSGTWVVLTHRAAGIPVQARWPRTHFVPCPPPSSFCRAVNAGIAMTSSPWVFLLNDDVVLEPDFLERLLDGIPPDERIGMVCGRLFSSDGRRLDSTGQFLSRAWTARERGYGSRGLDHFNRPGPVFSVPAAAALYRRTMLEAIAVHGQYFDERLAIYLEDLDVGWRAQHAGWQAYYVPQAKARHARGSTAKTRTPRWAWLRRYYLPWLSPKLQVRYLLNRYRLIARYETLPAALARLPWVVWYELRLWAYLLACEPHTVQLLRRIRRRTGLLSWWRSERIHAKLAIGRNGMSHPAMGPPPMLRVAKQRSGVGPSGLLPRAGGRDVAPHGAGSQVPPPCFLAKARRGVGLHEPFAAPSGRAVPQPWSAGSS